MGLWLGSFPSDTSPASLSSLPLSLGGLLLRLRLRDFFLWWWWWWWWCFELLRLAEETAASEEVDGRKDWGIEKAAGDLPIAASACANACFFLRISLNWLAHWRICSVFVSSICALVACSIALARANAEASSSFFRWSAERSSGPQRAWAGGTKPVALDEEEEAAEDDTDDEELEAAASKPGWIKRTQEMIRGKGIKQEEEKEESQQLHTNASGGFEEFELSAPNDWPCGIWYIQSSRSNEDLGSKPWTIWIFFSSSRRRSSSFSCCRSNSFFFSSLSFCSANQVFCRFCRKKATQQQRRKRKRWEARNKNGKKGNDWLWNWKDARAFDSRISHDGHD